MYLTGEVNFLLYLNAQRWVSRLLPTSGCQIIISGGEWKAF